MTLIIAADDLEVGIFTAIHSIASPAAKLENSNGGVCIEISAPVLPVPPGVPLQVIGVSLPFVACGVVNPGGAQGGPMILDVRCLRLARVNRQFVRAIAEFGPPDEEIPGHADGSNYE